MATALLDDELWKLIEPLLPVRKRRFHHPGRKRLDDRTYPCRHPVRVAPPGSPGSSCRRSLATAPV